MTWPMKIFLGISRNPCPSSGCRLSSRRCGVRNRCDNGRQCYCGGGMTDFTPSATFGGDIASVVPRGGNWGVSCWKHWTRKNKIISIFICERSVAVIVRRICGTWKNREIRRPKWSSDAASSSKPPPVTSILCDETEPARMPMLRSGHGIASHEPHS